MTTTRDFVENRSKEGVTDETAVMAQGTGKMVFGSDTAQDLIWSHQMVPHGGGNWDRSCTVVGFLTSPTEAFERNLIELDWTFWTVKQLTRAFQDIASVETLLPLYEQTPRVSPTMQLLADLKVLLERPEVERFPGATWPFQQAFEDARIFIKKLPLMDIQMPEIRLASDGEINFLWDSKCYHVDLGFYGTGKYSYFGRDENGNEILDEGIPATDGLADPVVRLLAGRV